MCLWTSGCSDPNGVRPKAFFDDSLVVELTTAAQAGDVAVIDDCVSQGVDVNAVGEYGVTPLLLTFRVRNRAGYERLLKHGADPDILDEQGQSVTRLAALLNEDSQWLKTALLHGANPNSSYPNEKVRTTPLICAIHANNLESVKALVEAGADLDRPNSVSACPLLFASVRHYWEIVLLLLQSGADIHASIPFDLGSIDEYILWMPREVVTIRPEPDQLPWFDKAQSFIKEQLEQEGNNSE